MHLFIGLFHFELVFLSELNFLFIFISIFDVLIKLFVISVKSVLS